MKSMLTAFAALAALALPAGLPAIAIAQDEVQAEAPPPNDAGARYQPDETSAPAVRNWVRERAEAQPVQDRRGDRGDRGGGRANRDNGSDNAGQERGQRGGGDGAGGRNRGGDGEARDNRDRGEGRGGRNRPDQATAPVVTAPTQDRGGRDRDQGGQGQDWNRGTDGRNRDRGGQGGDGNGRDWNRGGQDGRGSNGGRGREGGRNGGDQGNATLQDGRQRVAPRGSFADSCSGSYVNQGRLYADCRDTRGNVRGTSIELGRCSSSDIGNNNGLLVCNNVRGDYEGRGGSNGGWDRDRDRDRNNDGRGWNSDRQDRRDYGGFRNRWNQNDWRRDWNRGRGGDWWRNDRAFRGYTGFRSGFYFAPNYGYYAVPRNYFGQRWSIGSYLPSIFWRYSLNDYRTYGLGYPPPGTQWVAVDTTIYLIDSRDGYIIEVIYDAWRW